MNATRRFPTRAARPRAAGDPDACADYGFSIHPDRGDLIYLPCRGMRATRGVDSTTSVGMLAFCFAPAVRDNGGGQVIGSGFVPARAEAARRNLAAAGLAEYADIRPGGARQTLRNPGGPVDYALFDGWPVDKEPSLVCPLIEVIAPRLRAGGYLLNDNAEPDFPDYIRDPANVFISVTLPLKRGTELALKVG